MGGLSGSLGIALGALAANRGAIAITSNNIANVNNPAYSRQRINLSENPPVQVGPVLFGTGVTLEQATSIRDNLLERRLDQENQSASHLDAFLGALNQVQALFNEAAGSGLQAPLTAFFNSFSQLSVNPTSAASRQAVITAGQNLASAFRYSASSLRALQSSTDIGVEQSVRQINQIAQQVAALNVQISGLESVGQDPGAFLDQRTQLLRQLSGLIEISEADAGNGSLTVTTSGGAALVVAFHAFALTTAINPDTTYHDVYSQDTNLTADLRGGALGGQIEARDREIPSILQKLDTLAYAVATAVNTQSQSGFDANGNAGLDFFVPLASSSAAASSLAVSISDPGLVAASSDGAVGSNGNAQALAALKDQAIVAGESPANYYSALIFSIGNSVSQAQAEKAAVELVQQQLQNQRGAISGVSLDEEAVNLIRFQSAYAAAANVVSVVNELLATTLAMIR